MANEANMGILSPKSIENIGERSAPAALLRQCERAIDAGHFEAAETYHALFVEAATK